MNQRKLYLVLLKSLPQREPQTAPLTPNQTPNRSHHNRCQVQRGRKGPAGSHAMAPKEVGLTARLESAAEIIYQITGARSTPNLVRSSWR
jgi:hypothetical protein